MEIIVASNNIFRRELSCFLLSEAGYTVHEISDSNSLLSSLTSTNPALILLDDRLDELDIDRYIRQQKKTVPVMIITSNPPLLEAAPRNGEVHLAWPYEAEDLLEHVEMLLSSNAAIAALSAVASA